MAKVTKISDKLTKVSENFNINMYDNGFMLEISGKDKKGDLKTAKLMVSSAEELLELVKEVATMERDS